MKEVLFSWIENIAFYNVLMILILHIIPDQEQKKYIQFFMGLIMILIVLSPLLKGNLLEDIDFEAFEMEKEINMEEFWKEYDRIEEHYEEKIELNQEEEKFGMEEMEGDLE